jgi:8-oxo-dGTP diphosphatase
MPVVRTLRVRVDWVQFPAPRGWSVEIDRKKIPVMEKGIDFIGVTTVYFCHDGNGKFVMAKRSQQARDEHGRWDIGGGGLEFGETVEERLRQEIREEYCTEILDFEFLGFRDVHRQHQGKPTHWISLDFKVRVDPEKVKIGEPHKFEAIDWFTLDRLPDNLHSQLPYFFEKYKSQL